MLHNSSIWLILFSVFQTYLNLFCNPFVFPVTTPTRGSCSFFKGTVADDDTFESHMSEVDFILVFKDVKPAISVPLRCCWLALVWTFSVLGQELKRGLMGFLQFVKRFNIKITLNSDWLSVIDWFIDCFIDWLTGCLIDWLIGLMIDYFQSHIFSPCSLSNRRWRRSTSISWPSIRVWFNSMTVEVVALSWFSQSYITRPCWPACTCWHCSHSTFATVQWLLKWLKKWIKISLLMTE